MDSTNNSTEVTDSTEVAESVEATSIGESRSGEPIRLRGSSREKKTSAAAPPRAPELLGADELAAAPSPFESPASPEPPSSTSTPTPASLIPAAPAPAVSPSRVLPAPQPSSSASSPAPVDPGSALDFASLLQIPLASEQSEPAERPTAPLLATDDGALPEEPDIARATVGEKVTLILSIIVPPAGVIASIVAAALSARRRGWVIGVLKAGLAIGIVLSVVVGIGSYVGLTLLRQQQHHDQLAAASAQFCATISADPSMIGAPDFGWPAVAASIPDSLAAMTAFQDKWMKLAGESPAGIKTDVLAVANAAKQIVASVSTARTIDDSSNVAVMTSVASASGVPAWYAEYCR